MAKQRMDIDAVRAMATEAWLTKYRGESLAEACRGGLYDSFRSCHWMGFIQGYRAGSRFAIKPAKRKAVRNGK